MRLSRRLCSALLVTTSLMVQAGCKLIDQTSFGGSPRAPAATELTAALASSGGIPLLVIRPDDGVPYGDALHGAIDAAEARNGNARFRLTSVVPEAGDLTTQQAALNATAASARQVLDDMGADGIAPDRVELDARTDPHLIRREIRLYQG